jgi:S-adenosylmethionine decarboxylase
MTNLIAPGLHLLIDFWGAKNLQNQNLIQKALVKAAEACGATVLEVKIHSFGEDSGITAVAILAESHITIHTWPEINYAALDVFVCGSCDANKAVPVLQEFFEPTKIQVSEHKRG